jgi:putative endonuclease
LTLPSENTQIDVLFTIKKEVNMNNQSQNSNTHWLYMLSNDTYQGPLYLGDTTDLSQRLVDHLNGERRDFAHYHKLERLVYFESWDNNDKFSARLRRVRNWPRDMRLLLIESLNPNWDDLTNHFFKSVGFEHEKQIRRRA